MLVLEAGRRDWHPFIHMPAGLAKLVNNKRINWDYNTEPEAALDDRRLWWPRGKVLGGSSSINAMCYMRGAPGDYDDWAASPAKHGWSWKAVLPLFKRGEDNTRGADACTARAARSRSRPALRQRAFRTSFVDAAAAPAIARNADFNGATQEGFGLYQVTQRNGARCSAAERVPRAGARARKPDRAPAHCAQRVACRRTGARGRRRISPSRQARSREAARE